jgi:signal transduction histidine kinase
MLIICPQCSKRFEIPKSNDISTVSCKCGETLTVLPWLSYRQVISDQEKVNCPLCDREYDLRSVRINTEIACSCGNLLTVRSTSAVSRKKRDGRRKTDHDYHLRQRELQGLIETSRLIHSAIHDLNELMRLIVRVSAEMLNVEGTSVVLYNEREDNLHFYAVTGAKSSELTSFRLAKDEGIAGSCIKSRSAILVNDVKNDKRFSQRADKKTGFRTRSILCVPLIVEEKAIGALEAVNKKDEGGFDKHDLLLAEAVASQIAVAMHNVRLHEESIRTERLAAIGQAVTGVAHCVNNMITGLNGGLFIIKDSLSTIKDDFIGTGFNMLEQSLSRLTDLVTDMLTYSKDRVPEYETVDINELIVSVVDLMKTRAGELGVTLSFKPDRGLRNVTVDPKGMYRSVMNLVTNALDASSGAKNASVTVRTFVNTENEVIVEIADRGCGMDEETLKSIFQPFYSDKGSQGTGLGLSITKKIVEENGGRIEVSSGVGEGSTFRIVLPVERKVPVR